MAHATPNYLDDFLTQQPDSLSRRLIETFRDIIRSADASADDYPWRLRQAMDIFFQEMIDEAPQSDDS